MADYPKQWLWFGTFYGGYLLILNFFRFISAPEIPNIESPSGGLSAGWDFMRNIGFGSFGPETPAILNYFSGFMIAWLVVLLILTFYPTK